MQNILMLSAHSVQVDRRILAEANALAAAGYEVDLVSVPAEYAEACLDDRVRVTMPDDGRGFGSSGDDVSVKVRTKRIVKRLPGPLFSLAKAAWYRFGGGPAGEHRRFFTTVAPSGPFDFIHCHDLDVLPSAVELKKRWSGAKLVYDCHELFPYQFTDLSMEKYWRRLEQQHIGHADLIITVNESIATHMAEDYGITKPAVIYNSYGVDGEGVDSISRRAFREHFDIVGEGPYVIFQGNQGPNRGLEMLVDAFELLDGVASLLFLGDGVLNEGFRETCRLRGIRNVYFGSPVSQEQLLGYVRHSDLGVIPYQGDTILNNKFCTPNKLFEFIEAGVPICANDLPELRKVIVGSGIGRVYSMNSAHEIAAGVRHCLYGIEEGAFSSENLESARDQYGWGGQASRLIELYGELRDHF